MTAAASSARGKPGLRILVVEDYEPFRRYLCSTLQQETDFQIIGQASNGLEAVQKAEDLQPDLILLDVGLPKLNGLETATRVRKLAPLAKILFLSQEFSFEMVEAALRAGALGYVHKLRAQSELLPAIEAILLGKYFVSGIVRGGFGGAAIAKPPVRHEVKCCSDDAIVLKCFADFIATTLRAGKSAIVVATEKHRTGVVQALNAQSADVNNAIKRGQVISLDDTETLSTFMLDDMPDAARFFDAARGLIEAAAETATRKRFPRVAVCRECPACLLRKSRMAAALRLEQLWNIIAHTSMLDVLCVYALADFKKHEYVFHSICAEHSAIYSR